jgi:histidinol-phosphate aminotransferase
MISIPSYILDLQPYKPGQSPADIKRLYGIDKVIKLASNENPLGASPLALQKIKSITDDDLSLYPDGGHALRMELSRHLNISHTNILTYNGSDALLHLIMKCFTEPGDEIISSMGTFVGYYVASKSANLHRIEIPLTIDYRYDVQAITNAVTSKTKIVYIANANNPTGTYINNQELNFLIENIPQNILIIMDEAYYEYSASIVDDYPNSIKLSAPNIITLRTFSKAYGLASLRVGYAIAPEDVISVMMKAKLPFDPGTVSQLAAIAALQDIDFVNKTVDLNKHSLQLFQQTFREQQWKISPSIANFSMIDCGTSEKADVLYMELLKNGFITRPLAGFGLPSCIRISTGTTDQNLALLSSTQKIRELFS